MSKGMFVTVVIPACPESMVRQAHHDNCPPESFDKCHTEPVEVRHFLRTSFVKRLDSRLRGNDATLNICFLFSIMLSILLLAGCKGQDREEIEKVKQTVTHYNFALAGGYKSLNMTPLLQFATEEHAEKVYHHMSAIGEGGEKMLAEQKSIVFPDVKIISPDSAEAKTKEEWDYTYVKIDSGETISRNSITYELTFKLVKTSGKWLVSEITVDKEKTK